MTGHFSLALKVEGNELLCHRPPLMRHSARWGGRALLPHKGCGLFKHNYVHSPCSLICKCNASKIYLQGEKIKSESFALCPASLRQPSLLGSATLHEASRRVLLFICAGENVKNYFAFHLGLRFATTHVTAGCFLENPKASVPGTRAWLRGHTGLSNTPPSVLRQYSLY